MTLFAEGTVTTVIAIATAGTLGGATVRALLGTPVGFNEDYVSLQAFAQSAIAVAVCLALAFLVLGATGATNRIDHRRRLIWAVNPVSLFSGFIAGRALVADIVPGDWDGTSLCAFTTLFGSFFGLPSLMAGAHIRINTDQ